MKRLSKIYPTKRTTMDAIVKTKMLAKKRKKILAIRKVMLPASQKKKKPSLRSLGTLVKEHVKSKIRQRKMHTSESAANKAHSAANSPATPLQQHNDVHPLPPKPDTICSMPQQKVAIL